MKKIMSVLDSSGYINVNHKVYEDVRRDYDRIIVLHNKALRRRSGNYRYDRNIEEKELL
jgi:hypothetical protein